MLIMIEKIQFKIVLQIDSCIFQQTGHNISNRCMFDVWFMLIKINRLSSGNQYSHLPISGCTNIIQFQVVNMRMKYWIIFDTTDKKVEFSLFVNLLIYSIYQSILHILE